MYEINMEFNGTPTHVRIHACKTKREAEAWIRSRMYLLPKGHAYALERRTSAGVSPAVISQDDGNVIPMGWRPASQRWMTQPGRKATDTSVYMPSHSNRRI